MIVIGDTLISEDLFEEAFICNLQACKGACCVEGDSGAPVTLLEKDIIHEQLDVIEPYQTDASKADMAKRGAFEKDDDDEWVTTCLPSGECNFAFRDASGILSCTIEKSFLDGKATIRKPISCYLYPIRLQKVGDYIALNYHRWDICKPACALGKKEQVKVYQFLREPLISCFGEEWYKELCEVADAYLSAQQS